MRIASTFALILMLGCSSMARADDGDDTLKFYLSKSPLVVVGKIVDEPQGIIDRAGQPNYVCQFSVTEVLKGDTKLVGETLGVNIVRYEGDKQDKHPLLHKNAECILFLKGVSPDRPIWRTVDVWFGMQQPSPWMARSLARLALSEQKKKGD